MAPTVLWVTAVWWGEGTFGFINIALAAIFHECGHLLAFSALGLEMPRITPVARGIRLAAAERLSYKYELIIAAAGPTANIAVWLIGLLWREQVPVLASFGEVSLFTALCNLVPMADLDGERILRCALAPLMPDRALWVMMCVLSFSALCTALLFSLIYYWYTGGGLYPAMLSLAALLSYDRSPKEKRGKWRKNEKNTVF